MEQVRDELSESIHRTESTGEEVRRAKERFRSPSSETVSFVHFDSILQDDHTALRGAGQKENGHCNGDDEQESRRDLPATTKGAGEPWIPR